MQQHQSILGYRHVRYLKVALVLCAAAIGAYAWHEPPTASMKPYGGTWLGYTLGGVSAFLIVWLMLLGVRRRLYRAAIGTAQGWASAHVYLGGSLLIIVTLHSAFEFGWNIHTLAYALMVAAIASGCVGIYAYMHYPELITKNLDNDSFESLLTKIADLDSKCRRLALDLPDQFNTVVVRASRGAPREINDSARTRLYLSRHAQGCPTTAGCENLKILGRGLTGEQARINGQLLTEMTRKRAFIDRVRHDLRYHTLLRLWLYFHVPLSFALLASVIAHVVSVFYFW